MTLRSTYDDPATTTRDPALLDERAGTTLKSARAFLAREGSAQTAAGYRRPQSSSTTAHSAYAPTGAPAGHWQADVVAFELYRGANRGRKFVLTVLHTTTRVAHARGLLDHKAARVASAFADILDVGTPAIHTLRVDGGAEFKGEFATLCVARGIELERAEAYTH